MTPLERLNAAIKKLEALKAASTAGVWVREAETGSTFSSETDFRLVSVDGSKYGTSVASGYGLHTDGWLDMRAEDADLIVTLHRTIDAQLTILRDVYAARTIERNWPTLVYTENALALADAILGTP